VNRFGGELVGVGVREREAPRRDPSQPLSPLKEEKQQISRIEKELMAKVAAGDRDAFAALYDQFCKPLHSLAYRILQEPADAEEIVQEVFMKLWTRAPEFNARKGSPFSWAMAMTRNRCIDRIRSYSRRNQLSDTFQEDIASSSLSSQSGDGLDKAGGYAIQNDGGALVGRIEGCYTNVVGLSLPAVVEVAARLGVPLV